MNGCNEFAATTNVEFNIPFPFSINRGDDSVVSSRISNTSRCWRPARSASAMPSATPATATPIISCRTRFIFVALPTSPVKEIKVSLPPHLRLLTKTVSRQVAYRGKKSFCPSPGSTTDSRRKEYDLRQPKWRACLLQPVLCFLEAEPLSSDLL